MARLLIQLPTTDEPEDRGARLRLVTVALGVQLAEEGTRGVAGWRGRIRTFDLLIQSQAPYRLATRQ